MNNEINLNASSTIEIYECLKNTGNITFIMSHKEERLFKKGCKSLDFMYQNMRIGGGYLNRLSKLFTVPIFIFGVSILNWYRGRGHKVVETALDVYELSWHKMDFIQVKEKNSDELYVDFFWLKEVSEIWGKE